MHKKPQESLLMLEIWPRWCGCRRACPDGMWEEELQADQPTQSQIQSFELAHPYVYTLWTAGACEGGGPPEPKLHNLYNTGQQDIWEKSQWGFSEPKAKGSNQHKMTHCSGHLQEKLLRQNGILWHTAASMAKYLFICLLFVFWGGLWGHRADKEGQGDKWDWWVHYVKFTKEPLKYFYKKKHLGRQEYWNTTATCNGACADSGTWKSQSFMVIFHDASF